MDQRPDPGINPDETAEGLPSKAGRLDEREGAALALAQRTQMLTDRKSFAVETTRAGHGPLNFMRQAKAADYKVNLVFVGVDDPAICLARVIDRVRAGGHNVPPDAIIRRFHAALEKLGMAFGIADRTIVFDNSGSRRHLILLHEGTTPRFVAKVVPEWVRWALPDVSWATIKKPPLGRVARKPRDLGW